MIPWILFSWEPGALGADSPLTLTRGCGCFFLFLKPSLTWLTATRITLWIWIFRLSLHARVTSWNLGLMTVVCFSWHSSSSQNKASSGETWHTQFPINNRPYIIDNIVHTWGTFMMVNVHDGEQNIYIWTCYLWEGATVVLLFVLVISMLWWNLLCTLVGGTGDSPKTTQMILEVKSSPKIFDSIGVRMVHQS